MSQWSELLVFGSDPVQYCSDVLLAVTFLEKYPLLFSVEIYEHLQSHHWFKGEFSTET